VAVDARPDTERLHPVIQQKQGFEPNDYVVGRGSIKMCWPALTHSLSHLH
jgi:hypothetical protein